jgi:hypothetical protein
MKQVTIGLIAYRNPGTEEFLQAKPICVAATSELLEAQQLMQNEFKRLIASGLKDYITELTNKEQDNDT